MEERITERIIYEEEEREIDLKQLFWTVLKRWRLILLITILCGAAGLVWPFLRIEQTAVAVSAENSDYERALESYESSSAYYQALIEEDGKMLESTQRYQEESLLYRIDAMQEACGTADVFVLPEVTQLQPVADAESEEGIVFEDTNTLQLLLFYQQRATDGDFLEKVAKELGTEPAYVNELIRADINASSKRILLRVIASDEDTVNTILDAVLQQIRDAKKDADDLFDTHFLEIQNRKFQYRVDTELQNSRLQLVANMNSQVNRLIANQNALDKLVEPSAPAQAQVQTTQSVRPAGRTLLKYGLIGLAAGLFLSLFLLAVAEVLSNRVMSAGEFNRRYHLRALTVLPASSGKRKGSFDRWLAARGEDHVYAQMPEAERYAMASANLSVYAPDAKDIVLVGQVGSGALESLAARLSEQIPDKSFHAAPCINENAASLETLKQYDHVILTEQIHASRYAGIDREMQVLRNWNKTIVGSVVLVQ
ncbi:MAG: hypothetical protein IJP92_16030 [Lachnospiraceae bacterium]|nr:hypothetical protein [Lachnospiraceae bacterium]